MVATSRLKQLLFIVAALALVSLGLVATISTASPARATDTQPCEPKDAWTETVVDHEATTRPSSTRRRGPRPSPGEPGSGRTSRRTTRQATFVGPAIWDTDSRGTWNVHDQSTPGQAGPDGVYASGDPDKGGNWFYRHAGHRGRGRRAPGHARPTSSTTPRSATPSSTRQSRCPDPGPETCPEGTDKAGHGDPQGETAESFCDNPVVEDGKKVVVCKYVGTPPGTPDHIIVVVGEHAQGLPGPRRVPVDVPRRSGLHCHPVRGGQRAARRRGARQLPDGPGARGLPGGHRQRRHGDP